MEADGIKLHVVPDFAQPIDVIVGRTFTELPNVAYVRINDMHVFGYSDNGPFRDMVLNRNTINFININDNPNVFVAVLNDTDCDQKLKKGTKLMKTRDIVR